MPEARLQRTRDAYRPTMVGRWLCLFCETSGMLTGETNLRDEHQRLSPRCAKRVGTFGIRGSRPAPKIEWPERSEAIQ